MDASVRTVTIALGELQFEIDIAGDPARPLVLLLHGWPQSSYAYRDVLPALARAGYLAVAPNQRGYSPGARPAAVSGYATKLLMQDALAMAQAFGAQRFHLVGHDWGGQLAWLIAAYQPERVLSLCALSRPHPAAFAEALANDPDQAHRSRHHASFADPEAAAHWVRDGAAQLRARLREQNVPEEAAETYATRLGDVTAFDATLHWHRAAQQNRTARPVPPVSVPTLYLWGDADATVGRVAAEATAGHVTGAYSSQTLAGVGHYLTDEAPERVNAALLAHLARYAG